MIPGAKSHERCKKMMLQAYLLHSMTLPERSKPSLIDVKESQNIKRFRNKIEQVNQ
jgi:signal recognition particle GTPase